jgi:hypothetical protein
MTTIILAFFTPSDAYKADMSLANESMALVSACEGLLA